MKFHSDVESGNMKSRKPSNRGWSQNGRLSAKKRPAISRIGRTIDTVTWPSSPRSSVRFGPAETQCRAGLH